MKMSFEGASTWIGATLGIILIAVLEVVFAGAGVYFLSDVLMKDPVSFADACRAGAGVLLVASSVKRIKA